LEEVTMSRTIFLALATAAVFGASAVSATIFAGVPLYTVMDTEAATLSLDTTEVNAFPPIALPCPASAGTAGCTIRVTVSSELEMIMDSAQMRVTISGTGPFGPVGPVLVAGDATGGIYHYVHSMQWVKKNIPAGSSPTITVLFSVTGLGGVAYARTMSIDVFTGLL
jgi:hypothetical protein